MRRENKANRIEGHKMLKNEMLKHENKRHSVKNQPNKRMCALLMMTALVSTLFGFMVGLLCRKYSRKGRRERR